MEEFDLLIRLIAAHLVGDFLMQPNNWVEHKQRRNLKSGYLYLHCSIHAALVIAATCSLSQWKLALYVLIGHFIIDSIKLILYREKWSRQLFFIDQVAHIVFLGVLWNWTIGWKYQMTCNIPFNHLLITTGILFLTYPSSIIIKIFISKWPIQTSDESKTSKNVDSLERAGSIIGIFERLFVFTFILLGSWEAIGFLLAAKSIFRFGDLKESTELKMTEYVLIGTMSSFGLAFIIGLLCNHLLNV